MTSEIKPEDVKLPEPAMHDNGDVFGNDLTYGFTADQVRAAVLEAKAQERERLARLVESMWEIDGSHTASLFAAAIRSGHSITETQRAEE